MSCIDKIKHGSLLEGVSFKEAQEFIEKISDEVFYVEPGYKILEDCYLVGFPPIALGISGSDLIFPVVRPHLGTFVVMVRSESEIERLRELQAPAKL